MKIAQFITSLLILWSASVVGQNMDQEVRDTFSRYFKTIETKDNQQTLAFVYPKLFEIVPKNLMLEQMEKLSKDTVTEISMSKQSVSSVSDMLEIEGVKYALVSYSFIMHMKMNGIVGEELTEISELTNEMLVEQFGPDQVTYNKGTGSFDIVVATSMYAINDPAFPGWKFLEKKEGMDELLVKIIPKEVIDKF